MEEDHFARSQEFHFITNKSFENYMYRPTEENKEQKKLLNM